MARKAFDFSVLRTQYPDVFGDCSINNLGDVASIMGHALQASGVTMSSLLGRLDVAAFSCDAWFDAGTTDSVVYDILRGTRLPTGEQALALCRAMDMKPAQLVTWCEGLHPLPNYVIEANLLFALSAKKARLAMDEDTHALLAQVVAASEMMGERGAHSVDMGCMADALEFIKMAAGKAADDGAVPLYASGGNRLIDAQASAISETIVRALEDGEIASAPKRSKAAMKDTKAKLDMWTHSAKAYAVQLAPTGKADALIAGYAALLRDMGHEGASKRFEQAAEKIFTLRHGWERSAEVPLKGNVRRVRGVEVLKGFAQSMAWMQRYGDAYKSEAQAFWDDVKEYNRWEQWAHSPSVAAYLRLKAQSEAICQHIGRKTLLAEPKLKVTALAGPNPRPVF